MEQSKDFIRGFNSGYTIRKNHPLLMKNMLKGAKGNSELLEGIKAGGNQYEQEINKLIERQNKPRMEKGSNKGLQL